jgi:hypothetical protein
VSEGSIGIEAARLLQRVSACHSAGIGTSAMAAGAWPAIEMIDDVAIGAGGGAHDVSILVIACDGWA